MKEAGNLQDCKSMQTLNNVKSESLAVNDFDRDHIKDLSKMKQQQLYDVKYKVPGAEHYIQWVGENPFFTFSFSEKQMQVLRDLMKSGVDIVLHVDATGSIIASPEGVETRIYYYIASLALQNLEEETKLLLPLIEMISSAHDSFTIGTWLGQFRAEFIKKFNVSPLFSHFVTDFSYAILNAGCKSLNN